MLGMADWAHSRLAHLPRTQLDRMWSIYIAGEYNAMPVVLADLYALTGDEKHLETAKCFINTDALRGGASTTRTPSTAATPTSTSRSSWATWRSSSRPASTRTSTPPPRTSGTWWSTHRTYTDGGMAGIREIFGARDVIAATINGDNAETCPVYNMLKLSRSLFFHTADPTYMQYYERALYGQILASRQNTSTAARTRC